MPTTSLSHCLSFSRAVVFVKKSWHLHILGEKLAPIQWLSLYFLSVLPLSWGGLPWISPTRNPACEVDSDYLNQDIIILMFSFWLQFLIFKFSELFDFFLLIWEIYLYMTSNLMSFSSCILSFHFLMLNKNLIFMVDCQLFPIFFFVFYSRFSYSETKNSFSTFTLSSCSIPHDLYGICICKDCGRDFSSKKGCCLCFLLTSFCIYRYITYF